MEADFLREYGMDLGKEMDALTWRRFLVLLRHLPPEGAVGRALLRLGREGTEDQEQAEAFFHSLMG